MRFSAELRKQYMDEFGDKKRRMLTLDVGESSPFRLLCVSQDGSDVFIGSVAGRLLFLHMDRLRKHSSSISFELLPKGF